jgi:hypothetical protein
LFFLLVRVQRYVPLVPRIVSNPATVPQTDALA